MRRATGPFTTTIGPENQVVQSSPCIVNSGTSAASTAARTTGMYSGLQPAITALIATFSTVHGALFGGIAPTVSCGSRVVPPSMRSTRTGVGGTTGSPVAPAAREAQLVLVLGGVHVDDAGVQGGIPERDLQDLRHAGVHALRAAARLEIGEIGA